MSKGAVIFAYNSTIDYVAMATLAAKLVQKYLDIPVTLITNSTDIEPGVFDQVIIQGLEGKEYERVFKFGSGKERVVWHNQNRASAYELSPYDQTLLIDADYLIFDSGLKYLFDTDNEIACYNYVIDISGSTALQRGARVGTPGIPMQWATVVYFTKNQLAEGVFEFMQGIKENYLYYAGAYNFTAQLYRNDYALSIALQALTGYNNTNFRSIPGPLLTANTGVDIAEVRKSGDIVFTWNYKATDTTPGGVTYTTIKDTNIHIMNKRTITDVDIINQLTELAL
jgi:hypothetical protein